MYDELIERLRETSIYFGESDHISVMMLEAADAIERLDAIAQTYVETVHEIEDKRKWIPVTERLPEIEQDVLVYLFAGSPYIAWHDGEYWYTDDFRLDEDEQPTHWMPLPQPPESEKT